MGMDSDHQGSWQPPAKHNIRVVQDSYIFNPKPYNFGEDYVKETSS